MNATIDLCGEQLVLRADRSIYWQGRKTLLIADPHVGKPETFRAAGLPIPGNPTEMLIRLQTAIRETESKRLIVLGDFWHARAGQTDQLLNEITRWRKENAALDIILIRGNHDRSRPPESWVDNWQSESLFDGPFVFAHLPDVSSQGYVLAGHLHPGVRLSGRGREQVRLPCFWLGSHVGVLPAFGDFTGLADVNAQAGDRVFAIAGDQLIDVSSCINGATD